MLKCKARMLNHRHQVKSEAAEETMHPDWGEHMAQGQREASR